MSKGKPSSLRGLPFGASSSFLSLRPLAPDSQNEWRLSRRVRTILGGIVGTPAWPSDCLAFFSRPSPARNSPPTIPSATTACEAASVRLSMLLLLNLKSVGDHAPGGCSRQLEDVHREPKCTARIEDHCWERLCEDRIDSDGVRNCQAAKRHIGKPYRVTPTTAIFLLVKHLQEGSTAQAHTHIGG